MSTQIESPEFLETLREARIVRCWRRFKESRKVHKKRYFFGTCLLKLGAFTAFLVVSGLKFDEFMRRPKYVAVCQYVVSDELDLVIDESNCHIEVDEKPFTCDNEYGESPTSESNDDSEDSGYGSGDTSDTGYDNGDTSDAGYDSGDTSDTGYDSGDTSDTGYDSGDTSDTGNTGDNSGAADQGSSSEGDSAIPPSRTIRRALSSSRYLQYSDSDSESESYLYSDEADSAKDFANDIKKGYLVLLYLVWILFNIGFRIRSNLYTYRSRILQTIPSYNKTKKLKIALYENLIDICVATALYPFTYPDY